MPDHPIAFGCRSLAEGRRLLSLVTEHFPARPEASPPVRELFLDTFDGRIRADGGAVSAIEVRGGPLVLHWRTDDARLLHRIAVDRLPRFASDLPESPFREALSDLVGIRCLLPLVVVRARRTEVAVEDGRQKTVARLVLEHGTVADPGRTNGRRRLPIVLRIHTVRGYEREARRLARFLESHDARATDASRLAAAVTALGHAAAHPPAISFDGDPHDTAERAMRRILALLLDTVRSMEDGVRRDLDTEFLHDFRVAVRRARSLLGQLDGVLSRPEVEPLVKRLKWLARSTNVLRDLDVYLLCMPEYRRLLPETDSAKLDPVEAFLRQWRGRELHALREVLDGSRYASTLRRWERVAGGAVDETPSEAEGARPIREVAAERIAAIYGRVLEDGRAIDDAAPPENLHRLRIDCKKLRYLLEFFCDVLDPDQLAKPVKALKRLQDNLGRFNDLNLQQAALRHLSTDMVEAHAPAEGYEEALAKLVEILGQQQRDERAHFAERFARFDSPSMRRRITQAIDLDDGAAP